jgi:hypothetical protein
MIEWEERSRLEVYLSEYRGSPGWVGCYDKQTRRVKCRPGCVRPREVLLKQYPQCPERMRQAPRWQLVVQLYNQIKLAGGVEGWPDRYLAWITHGVTMLESASSQKLADAMNKDG